MTDYEILLTDYYTRSFNKGAKIQAVIFQRSMPEQDTSFQRRLLKTSLTTLKILTHAKAIKGQSVWRLERICEDIFL